MMKLRTLLLVSLLGCAASGNAKSLLIVSIDGLHPDYVLAADRHRLQIPNLRKFVAEGAYARGVVGVTPTVTYPSHTTLMTGVSPAEHGIIANTPFDPAARNQDGWYWYAEDIRVPTLWNAATRSHLVTAAVNWPVTVGDSDIRYLLPEFWRAMTPEDQKLLRALSRPEGFQAQLEQRLGTFTDGGVDTLESDRIRTRFARDILASQRPGLMAVHLVALDGTEHSQGPFTPAAFTVLEAIDGMIGELGEAALAADPEAVIAIVSDHGFIATHTAVNLRVRFVEAGLIQLKGSRIESWDAQLWNGGAVAAVVLEDPGDPALRERVGKLLAGLQSDPKNGIARVLQKQEIQALGGFPGADLLVEFAPGFYLGSALTGELLVPAASKGTHGYLPDRSEMHATLLLRGVGIRSGLDLGVIDMRQIAPTLAKLLDLELPTAREAALPVTEPGQLRRR